MASEIGEVFVKPRPTESARLGVRSINISADRCFSAVFVDYEAYPFSNDKDSIELRLHLPTGTYPELDALVLQFVEDVSLCAQNCLGLPDKKPSTR